MTLHPGIDLSRKVLAETAEGRRPFGEALQQDEVIEGSPLRQRRILIVQLKQITDQLASRRGHLDGQGRTVGEYAERRGLVSSFFVSESQEPGRVGKPA